MYDCYEDEISPRQKMIKHAEKSVLLLGETKAERSSAFQLGNVSDVNYIVCNENIRDKFDCYNLPEFITFS